VKVDAAIGLPWGADSTKVQVAAAPDAIFAGADEIDMVVDLPAIIEGDERYLGRQLREVLQVCRSMRPPVLLKVIIEAAALTEQQKRFACEVVDRCGADFVKTSTGMHPAGGATVEDGRLMKEAAPHCKIKAAGGIRTAKQVLEFIDAGADRIGTSAGVQIIEEFLAGRL
jgi:deoxyribose-phosphate aldolase